MKRIMGKHIDGIVQSELDHFSNCPVRGALVDMRDLGQILAHVHAQEIEICEGAEPPAHGPVN
ncbi:MAG: hypothetical protein JWP25_5006 [Bradyrhizobium sp.]|nr:hypothetical protein [Bradyrhizobium sp.]